MLSIRGSKDWVMVPVDWPQEIDAAAKNKLDRIILIFPAYRRLQLIARLS